MAIGNLGKLIVFHVSSKTVITLDNMKVEIGARWGEHSVIGRKPRKQFLGPECMKISFDITLDAKLGIRPRKVMAKIGEAVERGKKLTFVIHGRKVGKHKWVITGMSETWEEIWNKGELIKATCSLELEEYM